MTLISKAVATLATSEPMCPNPNNPIVFPFSPVPIVVPQAPSLANAASLGIFLNKLSINPQVSSVGPSPLPPVPHTVIPRSVAAEISNDAFLAPEVIRSLRLGSWHNTDLGKGVLSLIPIIISNGSKRSTRASGSAM